MPLLVVVLMFKEPRTAIDFVYSIYVPKDMCYYKRNDDQKHTGTDIPNKNIYLVFNYLSFEDIFERQCYNGHKHIRLFNN